MNTFNHSLHTIRKNIEGLRHEIVNHKVYGVIEDVEDLQIFMQYHVYAVWDFMSLLKALQNNVTCTSIPWFPKGSAESRYLINEIVAGEESDIDLEGNRKSHFELYLQAMQQCGADTVQIEKFLAVLQESGNMSLAFTSSQTPEQARDFVNYTFEVIHTQKSHVQAAVFTFGREDLIPDMFLSLIHDLHQELPESISCFKYYLERHIEVDGDHHSHLALQMTSNLCGEDAQHWKEAEEYTLRSLEKRIALWNGAYNQIVRNKMLAPSV
jgi:hypothetical protein